MEILKRQIIGGLAIAGLCLTGSLWASTEPTTKQSQNVAANTQEATSRPVSEPKFDILGLTLGMSPDEVAGIFGELSAVLVKEQRRGFRGTDIEFLLEQRWMLHERGVPGDFFVIDYARPPSNTIIIGIKREFKTADSVPDERLRASLSGRYGEPDYDRVRGTGINMNTVIVWYDGPDLERCGLAVPTSGSAENCPGPLLRLDLTTYDGANGRISRPREARLLDHAAWFENRESFLAHQAEIARKVEQERMQDSKVPNF